MEVLPAKAKKQDKKIDKKLFERIEESEWVTPCKSIYVK